MQTFLPYPDFAASARCLDRQRLGKQRVEVKQMILTVQADQKTLAGAWAHHPATKMWLPRCKGFLIAYGAAVCREWINRGYKDSVLSWLLQQNMGPWGDKPWWLGDERLHSSHRSNLLRKDPKWYGQFKWKESPDLEYWWPSQQQMREIK